MINGPNPLPRSSAKLYNENTRLKKKLINQNLIKGGDLRSGVIFVEEDTNINHLEGLKKMINEHPTTSLLSSNSCGSIIPKGIFNKKKMAQTM